MYNTVSEMLIVLLSIIIVICGVLLSTHDEALIGGIWVCIGFIIILHELKE